MPEKPDPRARPHPWERLQKGTPSSVAPLPAAAGLQPPVSYIELAVTSNFSFLRGGSHPDELVAEAAALGYAAVAIADRHTLAGIVRAHVAAKEAGIGLVVGCRLVLAEPAGLEMLVYPTDRASYGRLCQLLTFGKRRAAKGECELRLHDLLEYQEGLLGVVVGRERRRDPGAHDRHEGQQGPVEILKALREVFADDRLSLAMSCPYGQDDRRRLGRLAELSRRTGVPLVATNDVYYHSPQRRALQDVLTCIRLGCTLDEAGLELWANAERHLKPPEEMARLFAAYPAALARSVEIAQRAMGFHLDQLRYQYPHEMCPAAQTPMRYLVELTWRGAAERYPAGVPAKVRGQIEHEFALIEELNYAPYFLTVYDLVRFARSQGILCQGRGAAANSAVCYCLGLTAVDPDRIDVLFERFVSRERNEPPDIDIDFEHERREEVIQYIYGKYGRQRAALTAEAITYRGRSAVREVGKALGLSLDLVDRLAKSLDGRHPAHQLRAQLREMGLDGEDATLRRLVDLVTELQGFPRHRSQHVGGFVITEDPLCQVVPIENAAMPDRTVIEWDKDDIEALGMLKVDVLGLGMLTCVRKAFELTRQSGGPELGLADVPAEDPAVYDMICAADTVGVFQIESRAQMAMLPRLRPRCYYDLVIEVAIVRPGPIQGDMVHPYLRRRNGEEPVEYPDERIKGVLGKTLGVPLFQEQVMSLAVVAAGFTPGEADQLRRAIAGWNTRGDNLLARFGQRVMDGMIARGYSAEFARRCFEQIKGFGDYGFPESHAASFALLVYVSAWLKRYYPAAFAAALLNSQPMGFYAPAQIVRDAREHGVEVRAVDVNHSGWDCRLEERPGGTQAQRREGRDAAWGSNGAQSPALRLGMRLIKGMRESEAKAIERAVAQHGCFRSLQALWRASGVRTACLRTLAAADAFASMGIDRQTALWQVGALRDDDLPLFDTPDVDAQECPLQLPKLPGASTVAQDYRLLGLSLRAHPMSFLRQRLAQRGVRPASELKDQTVSPNRQRMAVAGVVLLRQCPATAKGVIFMTLEDETGTANLVVRPPIFERYRKAARHGVIVTARGRVERQGQVVHLLVESMQDISDELGELDAASRDFH